MNNKNDDWIIINPNKITKKQKSFLLEIGVSLETVDKLNKYDASSIISAILDGPDEGFGWGYESSDEWYK